MIKRALIRIDVQKGFQDPSWGPRNNPQAEKNMHNPLQHWRKQGGWNFKYVSRQRPAK